MEKVHLSNKEYGVLSQLAVTSFILFKKTNLKYVVCHSRRCGQPLVRVLPFVYQEFTFIVFED